MMIENDDRISPIRCGSVTVCSNRGGSGSTCGHIVRKLQGDISSLHHTFQGKISVRRSPLKHVQSKLSDGIRIGKHLLAGALSAAICKTIVAPIERLKMDIVLRNTSSGPIATSIEILRQEGLGGFWRGNGLNIIRTAPFRAINFYAFDIYYKALLNLTGRQEHGTWERFTAGALSGVTAFISCLPLDTIRTRLLANKSLYQYNGFGDCFAQTVQKEGVFALYKGCLPGILSIAPGGAVYYGVYGTLKQAHLNRSKIRKSGYTFIPVPLLISCVRLEESYKTETRGMELPMASSLLYGAIAGMCSEVIVYPLEVIRRQLQLQHSYSRPYSISNRALQSSSKSLLQACRTIITTHGLGGFYAGVFLNMVQLLPSAALGYFTYEAMKAILQVDVTSVSRPLAQT